jgi:hypothetical protein
MMQKNLAGNGIESQIWQKQPTPEIMPVFFNVMFTGVHPLKPSFNTGLVPVN